MTKITLRPYLRGLPIHPLIWAVGIDSLDFLVAPATAIPIIGEGPKIMMNVIQGFLSFLVFENPLMWFFGMFLDTITPSSAVAFMPSYTLGYVAVVNNLDIITLSAKVRGFIIFMFVLLVAFLIFSLMMVGWI